ncbi:unnamed protein product [Rodentolepis nana]|uniref:C2H2-type domain-containing protein n=1 Tax=Rodentolepis nana TaxID=102285 RepID=A0A3P7T1S3_RODNA|nr:unnamed protein product [Rodentolepis nana]
MFSTNSSYFSSIVDNDLPIKHGPLDEAVESIAKMSKETTNSENRFICDVCKNTFKHKRSLNAHKRRHSDEKPFKCESCGNQFFRKFELNSHKMVHSEERPYKCRKCGEMFKRQGDLSQHMRSHSGESECNKGFLTKQHMERHMLVHTDERP